jgi:hypothetical protein
VLLERLVQVLEHHASLHGGRAVIPADGEDAVHPLEIDDDATTKRDRTTHQPGAATVRDDGHAVLLCELHDSRHLLRGLGPCHDPRSFAFWGVAWISPARP